LTLRSGLEASIPVRADNFESNADDLAFLDDISNHCKMTALSPSSMQVFFVHHSYAAMR
jgi:hypothetical protein